MKRYIILLAMMLSTVSMLRAQRAGVENVSFSKNGQYMVVDMDLLLSQLGVKSNEAVVLTPYIINNSGSQRVELPSVAVYGRTRYYHYLRNNGSEMMITGPKETSYLAKKAPATADYRQAVDYEPWMENSSLVLGEQTYGCCGDVLGENQRKLADNVKLTYTPSFVYVQPQVEAVKSRALSGSAFIDFVVNRTDIRPDYRRNPTELAKIRSTIDSIKNDADIQVQKIYIKGFASPEGSYQANDRLAAGRTEALRKYVAGLYDFPASTYETDHVAEDWDGLVKHMETSSLGSKNEILDIIRNSGLEPDAMEWRIKSRYAQDYQNLLQNVYPGLRHSDYRIEYTIRGFNDINEIKNLVKTQPQKLSLQEFFLASQQYQPGSADFNEVFQTAVRIYPQDETANLNAAVSALNRGDLMSAEAYLKLAGNSPQAAYAKGVLAGMRENYNDALSYFRQAQQGGVAQAANAITQIEKIIQ